MLNPTKRGGGHDGPLQNFCQELKIDAGRRPAHLWLFIKFSFAHSVKIWSGLGVSVKSYGGFVEGRCSFPYISYINWKYKQMLITSVFIKEIRSYLDTS